MSKERLKATISRRRWTTYGYAFSALIGALALAALLHIPLEPEHWSYDWMVSKFSCSLPTQHKSIVLVYISESSLSSSPYVSPVDRRLLSDVIQRVDQAGAQAIGLDIILDRETEQDKDDLLRQTIGNTNAKLVLGIVDENSRRARVQSSFIVPDLRSVPPEVGTLYFDERHGSLVVSDHVVRFIAESSGVTSGALSEKKTFAEALAHAVGSDFRPASHYIDWLLQPKNGSDTFLTLQAEDVLGLGQSKLALHDLLNGKIVLIGGNFDDRDQHLTPLSASRDDFYPGLFIHAQILAQLLAKRSVHEMSISVQLALTVMVAISGLILGQRSGHYQLWLELVCVLALVLTTIASFYLVRLMFPYTLCVFAWLGGAAVGHYGWPESRKLSERRHES